MSPCAQGALRFFLVPKRWARIGGLPDRLPAERIVVEAAPFVVRQMLQRLVRFMLRPLRMLLLR